MLSFYMPNHGHTVLTQANETWNIHPAAGSSRMGKPHLILLPKHPGRAAGARRVWCVLGCACTFPISPQKNQLPITSFLPLVSHSCSLWHHVASEDLWPPSHISCFSSSIPES